MENVRNFASHGKSFMLQATINCLHVMGYQITFGVLQAGNYGIPQARRRFILMAAASDLILPKFPEPLHVFNTKECQLGMKIDDVTYYNGMSFDYKIKHMTRAFVKTSKQVDF